MRSGIRAALAVGGALAVAGPAAAGEIYSWRTDDGDVAFTDQAKNVPPRYRDRVEVRRTAKLAEYERYSSQHEDGTELYRQQLAQRVEQLRAANAAVDGFIAEAQQPVGRATLRINGASDNVISVEGDADAPVIVERVRVRSADQIASRHDTIVRQGDRTLAILRGSQRAEQNASLNVVDEDDL